MPEIPSELAIEPGYLAACQATARTPHEGRTAFLTWCFARACGWDLTRRTFTRSTWYRHLRICRKAGLPVPVKRRNKVVQHRLTNPSGWFGAPDWETLIAFLTEQPARLYELVGQRFRITQDWDSFYPAGTTGVVLWLQYREGSWRVECLLDGSPGGTEDLKLYRFLRSTSREVLDHAG
jgi:hypothetical protein